MDQAKENLIAGTVKIVSMERILSSKRVYSFDTSLLDKFSKITIRGRDLKSRKYEGRISCKKAVKLVEEGAAGIYHSTLIHHYYNNRSLRRFVLERDNNVCHYCGFLCDTIDHKMPKSKCGLSTPANWVCACVKCNRKKGNIEYEEYIAVNNNKRL